MKKSRKLLTIGCVALAACSTFVSCGDDKPDPIPNPIHNPIPNTAANNKEYLEYTANEFSKFFVAEEFDNIKSIQKALEKSDGEVIEDQYGDAIDALRTLVGNNSYSGKIYNVMLKASTFNGHFSLANGAKKWTYSSASDVLFDFYDTDGKKVVAKITYSGESKGVYIYNEDDWKYSYNYSSYTSWKDETRYGAKIPETIKCTVTQGSKEVLNVSATIKLSGIEEGQMYNLSKINADTKVNAVINGLFTVNVSQAKYTAKSNASASVELSKNGSVLMSATISGDGELKNDDFDEIEVVSGKNINASVDILGLVQVKGCCSNPEDFSNYIDKAYDNERNETQFKNYVSAANSLIDGKLYFNGESDVRATVSLGTVYEESYYYSYWEIRPQINYADGTSFYMEDYFTEDLFKTVVNTYEELFDNFEERFDF